MRLTRKALLYIRSSKSRPSVKDLRHLCPKTRQKQDAPFTRDGLSYHWDTTPPKREELKRAEHFFKAAPPKIIDSATKFRTVKDTTVPEVAFLGRSNVGKSTLLNALMGRKICHVSKQLGRTRSMNFFAVGGDDHLGSQGRLVLLDMPGYGKGSREEWGKEIIKYLVGRKQLKRVFLLVNAQHGLKPTDEEILSLFRIHGIPHQVILSKVDGILFPKDKKTVESMAKNLPTLDAICADVKTKVQPGNSEGPEALGELICCSGVANLGAERLGIDKLRWSVLAATGLGNVRKKILPSDITYKRTA